MEEIFNHLGPFIISALASIAAAWLSSKLLPQLITHLEKLEPNSKFCNDIILALQNGTLTNEEFQIIADHNKLSSSKIIRAMRFLISETLTGRQSNLRDNLDDLKFFLDSVKREAPFDGLPAEIKVNLMSIKDHLGDDDTMLDPLITNLQRFSQESEKRNKILNLKTNLSLSFGIIGIFVGLLPFVSSLFNTGNQ